MPTYKLTYFDIRGRAEVSRLMLAMANQEYEDNRVTGEEWKEFKRKAPMAQLPCLEIDDKLYCQSHAIERYFAKTFGLYGNGPLEQLKCDMVIDCLEDMFNPFVKIFRLAEDEKAAFLEKYKEETVKPKLAIIETMVNENGFMVSDKITWADIAIFSMLENLEGFGVSVKDYVKDKTPKLLIVSDKVAKVDRIAAWVKKRPVTTM